MNSETIKSIEYVLELLDEAIIQQQKNVDEWLSRVDFYEGEGWDDITEQATRILRRSMDELQNLRNHRDRLQEVRKRMVGV